MADEREYVLGTGDQELARLGVQHQLWLADAARAWDLAGFGPGARLLDVGCGPGFATFDLAQRVGAGGSVHGVDVSERFVGALQAEAERRGLSRVTAEAGDVERMELPEGSFDGAWARWVLCFVRDPEAVVRGVARALRPGAAFAVQDYSRYDALTLAPPDARTDQVIDSIVSAWRDSGGDPRVGASLPPLMERCGLRVEVVEPVVRIARPGTPLWGWPRAFFDSFLPGLVAQGRLSPHALEEFDRRWAELERIPGACFHSPPMVRIVARKR